jgi:hypothetical protein
MPADAEEPVVSSAAIWIDARDAILHQSGILDIFANCVVSSFHLLPLSRKLSQNGRGRKQVDHK